METCEKLLQLGLKSGEHLRTNHLHREAIAQALRLHEAETFAAQDYHRKEVKMSNEQHAREILQERYIHEEDIDKERSIATRDNIRDDWLQLASRAETVLIVNTLVLAVAFAMLIEGHLPLSATITDPVLPVAYFAAIASSICFLFGSVRFAVLLRLRVTITIVKEMRRAIQAAGEEDRNFRNCEEYHRGSRPKERQPACDDERSFTHSFLSQLRENECATKRNPMDPASSPRSSVAFVQDKVPRGFEDLEWISSVATGFSERHFRKSLEGARKTLQAAATRITSLHLGPRPPYAQRADCAEGDTASDNKDGGGCSALVCHDSPGVATPVVSDSCEGEEYFDVIVDDEAEDCRSYHEPDPKPNEADAAKPVKQADLYHPRCPRGHKAKLFITENDGWACDVCGSEYFAGTHLFGCQECEWDICQICSTKQQASRQGVGGIEKQCNLHLHHNLSRSLSGVSLNSSTGEDDWEKRYRQIIHRRIEINNESQDALKMLQIKRCKPWEDAARQLMSAGSVMLLLAACILVFGRFFFQTVSVPSNQAVPGSPLACWAFTVPCVVTVLVLAYLEVLRHGERQAAERSRDQSTVVGASSGTRYEQHNGRIGAEVDHSAGCLTRCLLFGMPLSYALFMICAVIECVGKGAAQEGGSPDAPPTHLDVRPVPLTVRRLSLAAGSTWPPFWEPSGAAWLPERKTLLLIGSSDVIEATISGSAVGGVLNLSSTSRLASGDSPLVDICSASTAQGKFCLLAVDAELKLYAADLSAATDSWHGRTFMPMAIAAWRRRTPVPGITDKPTAASAALAGGRLPTLACRGPTANGSVQLWLSDNDEAWPLLAGVRLDSGSFGAQWLAEIRQIIMTQHFQTRWLLADRGFATSAVHAHANLRGGAHGGADGGISLEAVEVARSGGLLLLLSIIGPSQGVFGDQLIIALGTGGRVLQSWPLAQPEGGARWVALAITQAMEDTAGSQLLIVAGGPAPVVATVEIPREYL